jgi:murein DD-endopeptidase MepM/ murein hydrolase activator NlpD
MPRGRRLLTVALVALAASGAACAGTSGSAPPRARADVLLPVETVTVAGLVPRAATLDRLLASHGLSPDLVLATITATRRVFDPRRLRAGQPYRLVLALDGTLRHFSFEIDAGRSVEIVGRDAPGAPALEPRIVPIEIETAVVSLRAAVDRDHPSIIAALDEAGEDVPLAVDLADILGGEVDFNNDLQVGDTIDVVFEKRLREGRPVGYGAVLAAELSNAGRIVRAFRFTGPDGKTGYYDDQGRSLRRFFLKSPLPFQPRVTSRFSRSRMHPVLQVRRAHLGVDYGAPVGTPVKAVAGGVVVAAGFNGEAGRLVHIRHTGGYESLYLHLSGFADGIRRGARVDQGQVIGRVGASGTVTGPHLDFRLRRNGSYINPLTAHRNMPPGTPVDPAYREAFFAERDRAQSKLVGG